MLSMVFDEKNCSTLRSLKELPDCSTNTFRAFCCFVFLMSICNLCLIKLLHNILFL